MRHSSFKVSVLVTEVTANWNAGLYVTMHGRKNDLVGHIKQRYERTGEIFACPDLG